MDFAGRNIHRHRPRGMLVRIEPWLSRLDAVPPHGLPDDPVHRSILSLGVLDEFAVQIVVESNIQSLRHAGTLPVDSRHRHVTILGVPGMVTEGEKTIPFGVLRI